MDIFEYLFHPRTVVDWTDCKKMLLLHHLYFLLKISSQDTEEPSKSLYMCPKYMPGAQFSKYLMTNL